MQKAVRQFFIHLLIIVDFEDQGDSLEESCWEGVESTVLFEVEGFPVVGADLEG